ncbi:uncharacterized protein LOC103514881 [Diaphorina citri]|uniref:Uncharacterized protein LOC103514881 n=1 Tax=Diaphorina citri TaxID=121845 RepID=A0A1S3DB28_DIACI|nr:uncharacterized protein LOC103514881 [Diaphorina citri]
MNIHGRSNLCLIGATWMCLLVLIGANQEAPQKTVHKPRPKPKGFKIDDLPGLSEADVDANKLELRDVIRDYGPKALLKMNLTRYYQLGYEETFYSDQNSEEKQAMRDRRWADLMDFFYNERGINHFKGFWWPHYLRLESKKPTTTYATLNPEMFWNIKEIEKAHMAREDEEVSGLDDDPLRPFKRIR